MDCPLSLQVSHRRRRRHYVVNTRNSSESGRDNSASYPTFKALFFFGFLSAIPDTPEMTFTASHHLITDQKGRYERPLPATKGGIPQGTKAASTRYRPSVCSLVIAFIGRDDERVEASGEDGGVEVFVGDTWKGRQPGCVVSRPGTGHLATPVDTEHKHSGRTAIKPCLTINQCRCRAQTGREKDATLPPRSAPPLHISTANFNYLRSTRARTETPGRQLLFSGPISL